MLRRLRPSRLGVRVALLVAGASLTAIVVVLLLVVPSLEGNLRTVTLRRLERSATTDTSATLLAEMFRTQEATPDNIAGALQDATSARVLIWEVIPSSDEMTSQDLISEGDSRHRETANEVVNPPPVVLDAVNRHRQVARIATFAGAKQALVARPFDGGDYVVLFARSLNDVNDSVGFVVKRIVIAGALGLFLAALIGLAAAGVVTRRLALLRAGAERIAGGQFDVPVVARSGDEVGDLARALDAMRLRLQQLDRSRADFIANASHELRTPLTSLSGFIELLAEDELDEATRAEFLASIREQLERLTKLATDLLDLSRLDAGGVAVAREEVDLADLAADCVREAQGLAAAHASNVELALGTSRVTAIADEPRVRQIVRALVDNAVRHTPSGTRVEVAAVRQNGHALVTVADNGPGIAVEALPRVFERFWRGTGAAPQGSGLGLAIAAELAERMDGRLRVRSRPGETVFSLELPRAVTAAATTAPQPAA